MKVFISYGFEDYKTVSKLAEGLATAFEVYIYKPEEDIGQPLWNTINKRLDWADVLVVYITPSTLQRAQAVWKEVGYAEKAGKFIIPLKANEVSITELGMLGGLKWIEVDRSNPEAAYRTLADTIWDYALTQEKQKRKELNRVLWVVGGLLLVSLFGEEEE